VGAGLGLHLIAIAWTARYAWAIHGLKRGVGDTVFYDSGGRPWFRMDEQRRDVALAQIAPALQNAVIAVEDHRFYQHPGVDPVAIGRALFRNVRSGGVSEGGSTISQQLARTLFLSNRRTWWRKAKEAVLAVLLEAQLTKAQVLELYLNRVYLSAGVYGVESMSQKLFGKKARDLDLSESALIAGLIRAPATLSPWSSRERALARSRVVLARMREEGYIASEAERSASAALPRFRPWTVAYSSRAGYAKEHLRQQFRARFGGDHPPDWQVHTTFAPAVQDMAERAVARGLARFRKPGLQAALVAIDPHTGDIVALVGGRDYRESQYNRAVRSRRQPGSAFKPFVFAAALERGWSPVSVLHGLTAIPAQGPEEWIPRNVHDEMPDALTLRQALLESNNRAAVALQQRISARRVIQVAHHAGMRDLPDVPSLALGTGLVTPLELTVAYSAFVNGGWAVTPRALRRVVDGDGAAALDSPVTREQVLSPESAFQMTSMLADVMDRGTGASARALGVSFDAGGKTGTTNDFKDAWFVGFSSSLVAGVWVGYDQPAAIGSEAYGARMALPIWADFMRQAAKVYRPARFRPPSTLRPEPLCRTSYLQPMEDCPVYTEYLKAGQDAPSRRCPLHSGSLRQRAERAVEGIFGAIGRRIKDIFK
jgi:1A family penicillin-binding protein